MDINWSNLRSLNGSMRKAFEELCCQLAACENIPPNSKFFRKGDPDAGIECYWQLENGDEWGWQAKFFLSPPGNVQWRQIDDSIEKALNRHQNMRKYIICLPIDRPDPKVTNRNDFMDKWNQHKSKWEDWASERSMYVEFDYWGRHEIFQRLSLERHRGRYFFWFKKEFFTNQWFENQVSENIANVGSRYMPELNIKVPIFEVFKGLGCTEEFIQKIENYHKKITKSLPKACSSTAQDINEEKFTTLKTNIEGFLDLLSKIIENLSRYRIKISWEPIRDQIRSSLEKINDIEEYLKDEKENLEEKSYGHVRYFLLKLREDISDFSQFTLSQQVKSSEISALLISGRAGTGKTHLLCEIVNRRIQKGYPTILLLGSHFRTGDPWNQIIQQLHLDCTRDEFLGALSACAQAEEKNSFIFIDALNEGEGRWIWRNYLGGLLEVLARYKYINIAISIRDSYKDIIIPDNLISNTLFEVVHHGFTGIEDQALQVYFDYYKIDYPSTPPLIPEFQNPLFLKLLCEGLHNEGLSSIPKGMRGITRIFEFFLDSVNRKLSHPEYLNFNSGINYIKQAVYSLSENMADKETTWLPDDEAQEILERILSSNEYEKSLLRHLISENILFQNAYSVDNEILEGVSFTYERLFDHIRADYLIKHHLNEESPEKSFNTDNPLGNIIQDEVSCSQNRGLIEALSIQLPELIQRELVELAPSCETYFPVIEAFIQSILWRSPDAFTEATKDYINGQITTRKYTFEQFLEVLLTISSDPDHPYNAYFFHKYMLNFSLPDRDEWWAKYLHNQSNRRGSVMRLLDWASSVGDRSYIGDESRRLIGIALSWYLAASNRNLRDQTTKALVNLFTSHIDILKTILSDFMQVNDPYILERLFAVAYGCCMRNFDRKQIREFALATYEWIFSNDDPPPHILLRDYARNIIELAIQSGINLDIDIEKIRPPYQSEWPSFEIPSEDYFKDAPLNRPILPSEEFSWGYLKLSGLIQENGIGGDFAEYVIKSNLKRFQFDDDINPPAVSRWILKKVLDLGWTVERFGQFDKIIQRMSYYNPRYYCERIGKKYQWIAYHECMARISDNFKFAGNAFSDYTTEYSGPWQFDARDIDPSCLLRKKSGDNWQYNPRTWWFPVQYSQWEAEENNIKWLKRDDDLPSLKELLKVQNTEDSTNWLTLEAVYTWDQKSESNDWSWDVQRRQIRYWIRSYIVNKVDFNQVFDWFNVQNSIGWWLPDSRPTTQVFLGEFFWSPAFKYHNIPYFSHEGWTRGADDRIPRKIYITSEKYMREASNHDHSIDENIVINIPSKLIFEGMDIHFNGNEGYFYNDKGEILAFDPSTQSEGPRALLINNEEFQDFLSKNNYEIIWVITGVKRILGKRHAEAELDITGIFRMSNNEVIGLIKSDFKRFDLQQISGIGPRKAKLLRKARIYKISDLVSCNPVFVANWVAGIGLKSLRKWIKEAKKL